MTVGAYWDLVGGTAPAAPAANTARIACDSTGNATQTKNGGTAVRLIGSGSIATATPADPTGTANATATMAGLALTFTPARSGNFLFLITCSGENNTATAGDGVNIQLYYGTGSAPANAAAIPGGAVAVGATVRVDNHAAASGHRSGLVTHGVASGLTLGTTYWADVAQAQVAGGTGSIKSCTISAIELP